MAFKVRGDFGDESRLALVHEVILGVESALEQAEECLRVGCVSVKIIDVATSKEYNQDQLSRFMQRSL